MLAVAIYCVLFNTFLIVTWLNLSVMSFMGIDYSTLFKSFPTSIYKDITQLYFLLSFKV